MPQNLSISLHSDDNSFKKNYEVTSANEVSESYLNDLSSIIKKAQQETNETLTGIIEAKALKKVDTQVYDNGEHKTDQEPTKKRVKNNSK